MRHPLPLKQRQACARGVMMSKFRSGVDGGIAFPFEIKKF